MNFQLMKFSCADFSVDEIEVPIVLNFRPPTTLKPFFGTMNYSGYLVATETLNPDLISDLN